MTILVKRGHVKGQFRHAPIYRKYGLRDRTVIIYGQGNLSRAMPMYVTYQDLVQIGIFIVALVSLICQIFRGKR